MPRMIYLVLPSRKTLSRGHTKQILSSALRSRAASGTANACYNVTHASHILPSPKATNHEIRRVVLHQKRGFFPVMGNTGSQWVLCTGLALASMYCADLHGQGPLMVSALIGAR